MKSKAVPAIVVAGALFVAWQTAEDRSMDMSIPRDILSAEGFREVSIDGSTATFAFAEGCSFGESIAYMARVQAASYQRVRVVVCCSLTTACTVRWPYL